MLIGQRPSGSGGSNGLRFFAKTTSDKIATLLNTQSRAELIPIDELMHHVLEEIVQWSRQICRQSASGGIIEKSSAVEAVLHHLCYDVGIEPHGDDEPAPAPNGGEEQAPAPGGVINSSPPGF